VIASKYGLVFDLLWDKYQARGRLIIKRISVVTPANLNDSRNG